MSVTISSGLTGGEGSCSMSVCWLHKMEISEETRPERVADVIAASHLLRRALTEQLSRGLPTSHH